METIGKRIERLRKLGGWSRPELGRRMAAAVGRAKPFSGEVIRLYEADKHKPGKAARKALAEVFKRDEAYIEFGDDAQKVRQPQGSYSVEKPVAHSAQEEIVLHLFAGLFKLQRRELIDEMRALYQANQITRKELGQNPLHGVSNAQIDAAFGSTPKPLRKTHPKKKHNGERDPGAAMGDYLDGE